MWKKTLNVWKLNVLSWRKGNSIPERKRLNYILCYVLCVLEISCFKVKCYRQSPYPNLVNRQDLIEPEQTEEKVTVTSEVELLLKVKAIRANDWNHDQFSYDWVNADLVITCTYTLSLTSGS